MLQVVVYVSLHAGQLPHASSWTVEKRGQGAMRRAVELHPGRYFQRILQIVDRIYAAACGETPWEQTLAEICQVGRLDGCALSMVDPLERRPLVLASYRLSSAVEADATLRPIPGNPQMTDRVLRSTPGAVWQDGLVIRDASATTTSFWTGQPPPNGLVQWACVVVGREQCGVVYLEVIAGAGGTSSRSELADLLGQLAPHLTRAWRFRRTSRVPLATPAASSQAHIAEVPAPDLAALPEMVRLRAEFGLTKAEARLALHLAEGSSLASAAQAFNVKLTTIRSQLQQVFAKTGTSRQSELVAVLLSSGYGSRRSPFPYNFRQTEVTGA